MSKNAEKKLSEIVRISRQYQRSIRIDTDLGREDALDGYICQKTAETVLESMSKQFLESRQRAFTWTGPYGGGKSSLAITLASAVSPDKKLRAKALSILKASEHPIFEKAFKTKQGWLTIPVVGSRSSIVQDIANALRKARGLKTSSARVSATSVIADLCSAAAQDGRDGTLLILDELGKFLEASALGEGDDIYFLQELAEAAARAEGKILVIGILHQSFGQYATRLGIDTRDDWAKIQGRYADIPLLAGSDEVVELVSRAIETDSRPQWALKAAQSIADVAQARRPSVGKGYAKSLANCWPLHPAMAVLLGPISRRQFGQNERSTFGFLSSSEPNGFRAYLNTTVLKTSTWYLPSNYYDYLKANLEQSILASSDGHRWAQAVEAVERTEAKSDNALHLSLIKCIAVLDLFKDGSGLSAEPDVIASIFEGHPKEDIKSALEDLGKWRVTLFKKHIGAWSVFEGSDFNIDEAVGQARATMPATDFNLLTSLSKLYPVIAKRHYHETGTFRWMNVSLCRLEDAEHIAESFQPSDGEFGQFLLALPGRGISDKSARQMCSVYSRSSPWPVVVGIPKNHTRIEALGTELLALQAVQSRPELEGDAVARREVFARESAVRASLEEQLSLALSKAYWSTGDLKLDSELRLSQIASALADATYSQAPRLWSELINRGNLSSSSVKARRELLYRMIDHESEECLGMEGYPAERGLYESLLRKTELHRRDVEGNWRIHAPTETRKSSFTPLWQKTREIFTDPNNRIEAGELHRLWAARPYGIKEGVMPVFFFAFLLAHKGNLAVYKDRMFVPRLSDADVDEYLQDENRFSLRWIVIDEKKKKIVKGISEILNSIGVASSAADPLEAARSLVAMVLELPIWTQRTSTLTQEARTIRDILLKASDPHKVLFVDLAAVLGTTESHAYLSALKAPIKELWTAYDALLNRIEQSMLDALDARDNDLSELRVRAENLVGITGDLRQDAFAARLTTHDGSRSSIEGILSLAANKPPRDWNDRDIDAVLMEIATFSLRFRQAEALAAVRGRSPTSEAFAVVVGAGKKTITFSREFNVPAKYRTKVESLSKEIAQQLRGNGLRPEILMAVLGHACIELSQESEETSNG